MALSGDAYCTCQHPSVMRCGGTPVTDASDGMAPAMALLCAALAVERMVQHRLLKALQPMVTAGGAAACELVKPMLRACSSVEIGASGIWACVT